MCRKFWLLVVLLTFVLAAMLAAWPLRAGATPSLSAQPVYPTAPDADDPSPPSTTVKLIFIHHSTGGQWLADVGEHDQAGGLGQALMTNNYFVSATNYQWGPRTDPGDPDTAIGSRTDIINWPEWFTGSNRDVIVAALYAENGQNVGDFGNWTRMGSDPGGENEVIMFKSCFPNSNLYGDPADPPLSSPNDEYTVANAKAVYNNILTYFATRQDKLFVVITAPPLAEGEYMVMDDSVPAATRAANARAFNDWLLNDWLDGYAYNNVAVFDYYDVLTSNGSASRVDDTSRNDEVDDYDMRPDGNHHYWDGSAVTHTQTIANNYSAYPYYSGGVDDYYDSHPTAQGHQKATAEFVPLLNVFYNRWKSGGTICTGLTGVSVSGPATGYTDTLHTFTASPVPSGATLPVTYTWNPEPDSGQGTASAGYTWAVTGTRTVTVTAVNCGGSAANTHEITIVPRSTTPHVIYLPLVLRSYGTAPVCTAPLTGVTISGQSSGVTGTLYSFTAAPAPAGATTPIAYTWTPDPQSGQNTASASYQWDETGEQTVQVAASNCSGAHTANDDHTITISAGAAGDLVQAGDFTYLGAFRLPDDGERPLTFEYGGNAMTFNPDGDPSNSDAFSGSLFVMGHDRLAYDELPDGNQVAELAIPEPVNSSNLADLPYATFLQAFSDVTAGHFTTLEEIPRVGMAYLNHPDTGPKIHLGWGQHMPPDFPPPTHGWFNADLSTPNFQGDWYIGTQNFNSVNGYMFEIPSAWADAHTGGRYLATGRMRDGGWGGMGPTLFAYTPWLAGGAAPVSGTQLSETTLLLYESSLNTPDIEHAMNNYQHPDEWEGGAWVTTPSGKSALLFAGTKGTGAKYWYGWVNPAGAEIPCVEEELVEQFTTCRLADGSPCPESDLTECAGHNDYRGWWSARFDAQIILYDPAVLAQVAAGTLESWDPQPYAVIDIDEHLYFNPPTGEGGLLGTGDQRRIRIGAVSYDRSSGLLYVLELFAEEAKPVVHVWRIQ